MFDRWKPRFAKRAERPARLQKHFLHGGFLWDRYARGETMRTFAKMERQTKKRRTGRMITKHITNAGKNLNRFGNAFQTEDIRNRAARR